MPGVPAGTADGAAAVELPKDFNLNTGNRSERLTSPEIALAQRIAAIVSRPLYDGRQVRFQKSREVFGGGSGWLQSSYHSP